MAPTGERGRGQDSAAPKPDPKKRGRKRSPRGTPRTLYKFNQDAASEILEKLRDGNYLEVAAAAAGISKSTLCQWLKVGKRLGKGPIWQFCQDVKKAKAEAEAMAVGHVVSAAKIGVWQASAWLLERRQPKRWGKRERLEHVGKDGGPIQSADRSTVALTSEQRIRRILELEAKAEGHPAAPDGSDPANGG